MSKLIPCRHWCGKSFPTYREMDAHMFGDCPNNKLPKHMEDLMKKAGAAASDRMFADPNWREVMESYRHLRVNGKPWDETHPQWPGERKK